MTPKSVRAQLYAKPKLYHIPGRVGAGPLPEIWDLSILCVSNVIIIKDLALELNVSPDLASIIQQLYKLNRLTKSDRCLVEYPIFYQLWNGEYDDMLSSNGLNIHGNRLSVIRNLIVSWKILDQLMDSRNYA